MRNNSFKGSFFEDRWEKQKGQRGQKEAKRPFCLFLPFLLPSATKLFDRQ
jgi:hypothetical protein